VASNFQVVTGWKVFIAIAQPWSSELKLLLNYFAKGLPLRSDSSVYFPPDGGTLNFLRHTLDRATSFPSRKKRLSFQE
jgi:hypothetical protein